VSSVQAVLQTWVSMHAKLFGHRAAPLQPEPFVLHAPVNLFVIESQVCVHAVQLAPQNVGVLQSAHIVSPLFAQ
jgi:hypothetical protein